MLRLSYWLRRFVAYGVDWYGSALLLNLSANALSHWLDIYLSLVISSLLISLIWFVVVPSFWQQTLGLKIMRLRIENAHFLNLLVRYMLGCLLLEGLFYVPSATIRTVLVIWGQPMTMVNWGINLISIASLLYGLYTGFFLHDRISQTSISYLIGKEPSEKAYKNS